MPFSLALVALGWPMGCPVELISSGPHSPSRKFQQYPLQVSSDKFCECLRSKFSMGGKPMVSFLQPKLVSSSAVSIAHSFLTSPMGILSSCPENSVASPTGYVPVNFVSTLHQVSLHTCFSPLTLSLFWVGSTQQTSLPFHRLDTHSFQKALNCSLE